MDKSYELKLKDLIAIKGIIDYGNRNKYSKELRELEKRYFPLMAYNVVLIGSPLLKGLEFLLN